MRNGETAKITLTPDWRTLSFAGPSKTFSARDVVALGQKVGVLSEETAAADIARIASYNWGQISLIERNYRGMEDRQAAAEYLSRPAQSFLSARFTFAVEESSLVEQEHDRVLGARPKISRADRQDHIKETQIPGYRRHLYLAKIGKNGSPDQGAVLTEVASSATETVKNGHDKSAKAKAKQQPKNGFKLAGTPMTRGQRRPKANVFSYNGGRNRVALPMPRRMQERFPGGRPNPVPPPVV